MSGRTTRSRDRAYPTRPRGVQNAAGYRDSSCVDRWSEPAASLHDASSDRAHRCRRAAVPRLPRRPSRHRLTSERGSSSACCDPAVSAAPAVADRGRAIREADLGQVHGGRCRPRRWARPRPTSPATVPETSTSITDGARRRYLTARQLSAPGGGPEQDVRWSRGRSDELLFYLAGVTRTDNATLVSRSRGESRDRRRRCARAANDALNVVHEQRPAAYLGWAYLPDVIDEAGPAHLDGIVRRLGVPAGRIGRRMPGSTTRRETLTHEAGHWLNARAHVLRRLQRERATSWTTRRPQRSRRSACPDGQDSCKAAGPRSDPQLHGRLVRLLLHAFTAGQAQRMRDAWLLVPGAVG